MPQAEAARFLMTKAQNSQNIIFVTFLDRQDSKASPYLRNEAQTQPLHGRNVEECAALFNSSQPRNVLR